jgi:cyanophycinase-like exopeptidase
MARGHDHGFNALTIANGLDADSVTTLIVRTRQAASASSGFEMPTLWVAGDEQAERISLWAGTPLDDAISVPIKRGVPVCHTESGRALLNESKTISAKSHRVGEQVAPDLGGGSQRGEGAAEGFDGQVAVVVGGLDARPE